MVTLDDWAAALSEKRWRPSINLRLALRNLARDRVRLVITITGIAFSVVLMAVQSALLIGFALTSSSLIDHSDADFWIMPMGTRNVDQAGEIAERGRYLALALPGVASATKMIVRFVPWKRPDGGIEIVNVVGIDPAHPAVVPWNFTAGSVESLMRPDGVIIDALYAGKLGVTRLGEAVEINGHRARVVGFTEGIRAFTQSPYVFADFATAQSFVGAPSDRTSFILVTAAKGSSDRPRMKREIEARFPDYDVWEARSFAWETRLYWLFTTGAGGALVIAGLLGLIVGIVIVAQTLYAATVERLREFATLRAIGAGDAYLRAVILKQSCCTAVIGYAVGMAIASLAVYLARNGTASMLITWPVVVALFFVTFAMCATGALISVRKVLRVDPAIVFK
jgi:putative ABC transport system permease protein